MGALKSLVYFAAGFYGGVYATQNYNVPKLDDPQNLLQQLQEYLKEFEKPKEK